MIRHYACIDFETSGLNPRVDRIIEVGLLVVRDGVAKPTESRLVRFDGGELPDRITEITGLKAADLVDGMSTEEALTWLLDTVAGLPLVGHNILNFDLAFLIEEARRTKVSLTTLADPAVYDTAALYLAHVMKSHPYAEEPLAAFQRRVFTRRTKGLRYNLTEACEMMGLTVDRAGMHRAAADVRHTMRLFEALQVARVLEPVEGWQVAAL